MGDEMGLDQSELRFNSPVLTGFGIKVCNYLFSSFFLPQMRTIVFHAYIRDLG